MKRRVSIIDIMFIGLIAIIFSFTSCSNSVFRVSNKRFARDINENPVSADPNNKNSKLSSRGSSNVIGDSKVLLSEKYSVTASFLNVRKAASAESAKLGALSKGDQVDVYGFKGNWAEIKFKGSKAFVSKNFIKKVEISESAVQQERAVADVSNTKSDSTLGNNSGFTKSSQAIPNNSLEKVLRTEYDGFRWYKYFENGYCGAKSMKGDVIIPTNREYDDIRYVPDSAYKTSRGGDIKTKNKWFRVFKNERQGACNYYGREIIAPNKYDKVVYHFDDDDHFEYYYVWLNGKEGICDQNGNEVLAPTYEGLLCYFNVGVPSFDGIRCYERGSWEPTGYTFNKRGKLISHHYSNTNESTSNGDGKKELAELVGGLVGNMLNQIINGVAPQQANDPQYQKYLKYKNSGFPGASTMTFEQFKIADARAAANGYTVGGGSNSSSSSISSSTGGKDCSFCDHSGRCKTCNGKGWYYSTVGTGAKITCPNCKDGKCPHCHGTGKL